jgi:hypothetical protein
MADALQTWNDALPVIRGGVTGVGVWTALNVAKPLAVEGGFMVLGLSPADFELAGHLRIPATSKLIESEISSRVGSPIRLRIVEGTSGEDWERAKRRDLEAKRLQEAAIERTRAEMTARTNWDSVYETLSRKYAGTPNKSIPQNRARFYDDAVNFLAESRSKQENFDDQAERNFARCIERVAQYAEVPSALVALAVLKATGEL